MTDCANCGAPNATGLAADGRVICCPACVFNPLGCRCRFGEPGVAETVPYPEDMDADTIEAMIDYADVGPEPDDDDDEEEYIDDATRYALGDIDIL